MRKITILFSALLVLAIPSAAQAHHSGPSKADHAAAVKACRAERGTTDASKAAFAAKYGTNHNKRNAFGKCVSQQAKAKQKARLRKQQEQQSSTSTQDDDHAAAVKACRDERGTTDASEAAFKQKYGTNENKSNAFGKCVSAQAKAQGDDNKGDDDQGDDNDDHGQGDDDAHHS
jgi:hypothetical protein